MFFDTYASRRHVSIAKSSRLARPGFKDTAMEERDVKTKLGQVSCKC